AVDRASNRAGDSQQIIEHLALAQERVAIGAENIARQYGIVGRLATDGHDTTSALAILSNMQELQAMHVAHRDRLLTALERLRAGSSTPGVGAWNLTPLPASKSPHQTRARQY